MTSALQQNFIDPSDPAKACGEALCAVNSGRAHADSLLPFIRFEENAQLAIKAVQNYMTRHPCHLDDEMRPLLTVHEILLDPSTRNRGAVLAGLVRMGDRRINAVTRSLLPQFSPNDIRNFTRVHATTIKAEAVYFYHDWLRMSSASGAPACVIADLCCGLMLMVVYDEYRLVEESLDDPVGFRLDQRKDCRIPYATFLTRVMPRFKSLAELKGCEYHMKQVITLWERHREIKY